MSSIKRIAITLSAASILPSGVLAEGLERVNINPSFLFESGSYAEYGWGSVNPSLPSTGASGVAPVAAAQTNDNVAPSFTASTLAAKTAIGDKIDIGLWYTNQGNGVDIDWGQVGIAASVSAPTLAGMVRYKLSDSMSIIGGLKRVSVDQGGVLSLPLMKDDVDGLNAADAAMSYTTGQQSATGSIYGIVSEVPAIGMRMMVLMESALSMDVPVSYTQAGGDVAAGTYSGSAKVGVGSATTISLQTGIAANTLLFGEYRMSNWKNDQVHVPFNNATTTTPVSTFVNGESYTIGVGRKFSDTISGSVSYHRDPASDCDDASALSPKCETQSLNLGAKLAISDNATLSLGYTWTQYGDATVPGLATLTKSSKQNIGARIGFKF
jgi:long-chain fatty acid transport protein